MATVKFDEGTKQETSLNLEDGEGVIFVKPPKNLIARAIGMKTWNVTVVITNRRLVVIPQPPNKKNIQIESYYYNEINGAGNHSLVGSSADDAMAYFAVDVGSGGKTVCEKDKKGDNGYFMVRMEMNFINILKAFVNELIRADARNPNRSAGLKAMDYSTYTADSVDRYYAAMDRAAKERAAGLDFVNGGQVQLRDYIVDVVNICVEEANK